MLSHFQHACEEKKIVTISSSFFNLFSPPSVFSHREQIFMTCLSRKRNYL